MNEEEIRRSCSLQEDTVAVVRLMSSIKNLGSYTGMLRESVNCWIFHYTCNSPKTVASRILEDYKFRLKLLFLEQERDIRVHIYPVIARPRLVKVRVVREERKTQE